MRVKVVLAEDEAIIRLDLRETLEGEGYEVIGDFGRGDLALDAVRNLRPDIAILDIKMPEMDGLQVAAEINRDHLCAVLILTAFSQRSLVEQARDAGAMAYLVKPFQAAELLPAMELALARFSEARALEEAVASLGDEKQSLKAKLVMRRSLDKAKGRLMDSFGLNEAESFRFIQKNAMDSRQSMQEIADAIIGGSLSPRDPS